MKKIDSYVKRWYDQLEDGRIQGTVCKKCGTMQFPPLPICSNCGGHDMEWVDIDGEGELIAFDDCTVPKWGPELGNVLSGFVRMKEGSVFQAFILGVDDSERDGLFDRLPVKVQAEVQQRDGFKYPAFRVVE